jgi:hypothetical protein
MNDHQALAQRFRPYYRFSSDPHHGGEKVRPCSWQWFVANSELWHGSTRIHTEAELAANTGLILQVTAKHDVSDLRRAANKNRSFQLRPNQKARGGQSWAEVAQNGDGLYAQVEELPNGMVVLVYWLLFMYNSATGGPALDHDGDIAAVSVVYDRRSDKIVRANFVMHGSVLEKFDLQAPQLTGTTTLKGVNANNQPEQVKAEFLTIAPDRSYQNGPWWHSPSKPAQVMFAPDPQSGRYEHLVTFIEWGTHEIWPTTTGSVTAAPRHRGDDVAFLPSAVRFIGSITDPVAAEAPLMFFNGKWGDPPGILFHRISLHPASPPDPQTTILDSNMTDRTPYDNVGLVWPPIVETSPTAARISVACGGDRNGAQVAIRWGHPAHDKNEYFPLWTIKRGATETREFLLPDTSSELEVQTEGGDGTRYSIQIWVDTGAGFPAQPSILLNHKQGGITNQDVVQNNVTVKRSSSLNKYGEQNIRIDTSHASPGPIA